jgi:methanogenic corrinoid protein MtbC1
MPNRLLVLSGGAMAERKPGQARADELLGAIRDAVVSLDKAACVASCRLALEEGVSAVDAAFLGLAAGMEAVKDLYARREYFIPEMLLSSDAFAAGLDVLAPYLKGAPASERAQIILGVVEGDVHDIGKNLVKTMLTANGWQVHDLGKDVKPDRFVEELERTGALIIGLSALMMASMLAIPKIIGAVKAWNPNVRVMVGGAPMTAGIAAKYGADGYAADAFAAVKEALRLLDGGDCLSTRETL